MQSNVEIVVSSALVNGQLLQLPGNVGGVSRYGNVGKLVFTQIRAKELQPAGQVVHVGGDGEVWDVELVPVIGHLTCVDVVNHRADCVGVHVLYADLPLTGLLHG